MAYLAPPLLSPHPPPPPPACRYLVEVYPEEWTKGTKYVYRQNGCGFSIVGRSAAAASEFFCVPWISVSDVEMGIGNEVCGPASAADGLGNPAGHDRSADRSASPQGHRGGKVRVER